MFRRSVLRSISEFHFGHPPLAKEFKAAGAPKDEVAPATSSKALTAKTTTAANGARIVTQTIGGANVSIGAYLEAGAKFDPASAPGLNYVFRWALTTSNFDSSLFQIDRTVRSYGAALEHLEAKKKFVGLRVDSRPDMWQSPVQNVFTSVAAPRFHEADIERFRDTMDNQLEEQRWQQPREYVVDQLETLAFYKEPLGSPRHVEPHANDAASSQKLLEHWAKHVLPSRVTIAGVNVDHQALLAAYENAPFPHSANAPHHARSEKVTLDQKSEAKTFTGGIEYHQQENRAKVMGTRPGQEPETIIAVGYKAFGADAGVKDYAASIVAQEALNVLIADGIRYEREDPHEGIRSFYRPYSSAGLIGFTVRADPSAINKAVVEGLGLQKKLETAKLAAAKNRAALNFYNKYLETTRDYCDFLGTSSSSAAEVLDAISSVTAADVQRVKTSMGETKPVLFATGETYGVPSLRQLGF